MDGSDVEEEEEADEEKDDARQTNDDLEGSMFTKYMHLRMLKARSFYGTQVKNTLKKQSSFLEQSLKDRFGEIHTRINFLRRS